jgi:hypothetical protein
MALADYYQRAAQAASQVIAGFNETSFRASLERTNVGLGVGRQAAGSDEGIALLDLTVRLLARLYPSLGFRIETGAEAEAERLAALARAINPRIEIQEDADIGISVGRGAPPFETTFFAGSNGWDALLSLTEPMPTGSSPNPLGAGAAACLAAANVFKRVLLADWARRVTRDGRFSTFHREKTRTAEHVPNDGWRLIGDGVLVGLGAIGNGAAWALGRAPLDGSLHLVDHQAIELGNLQRYVLAERTAVDRTKVEVAKSHFQGTLEPVPHKRTWVQFLEEHGYQWPHVLVALDTAADRRSVQAALSAWVANAWTQPGDLGLSVHGCFDGPGACLSCLYLPSEQLPNEDELVAHALGVPHLVADIRTLLHTGAGVSAQLLEAVAAGLQRPLDDVLVYKDRPVRELYVEGVCGGELIPLGSAGMPRQELHVPLAHQSVLAGILLAAALIQRAAGTSNKTTMITRVDVLGPLGEYLTQPALKSGSGLCICEDRDYLEAFHEKYDAMSESSASGTSLGTQREDSRMAGRAGMHEP